MSCTASRGTGTESDTALPEDAAVLEEPYSASEGSERPQRLHWNHRLQTPDMLDELQAERGDSNHSGSC